MNQKSQPKKQQKQNQPLNLSPNLLNYRRKSYLQTLPRRESTFSYIRSTIYGLQIVFLLVVGLNVLLNLRISRVQAETQELQEKLLSKYSILDEIKDLNLKISTYKRAVDNRIPLASRTQALMESIPNGVVLKKMQLYGGAYIESSGFNNAAIDVETQTPLNIAFYIANVLDLEDVQQIAISKAELSNDSSTYKVTLEVVY